MEISVDGLASVCAGDDSLRNMFMEIVRNAKINHILCMTRKEAVREGIGTDLHDIRSKQARDEVAVWQKKLQMAIKEKGLYFPDFNLEDYANFSYAHYVATL